MEYLAWISQAHHPPPEHPGAVAFSESLETDSRIQMDSFKSVGFSVEEQVRVF